VELQQLQCFIAVAEEGGFKRATARLGMTQPALSYQIKRLEEELGVQVFRRGPGGITPTEAGRTLLQQAHHVIAAVREAHQAVREVAGGVSGEIRIGAIKCVGQYFLPEVLKELRTKHPRVRPNLVYKDSDDLLDALLANTVDVAMVVDPAPDYRVGRGQRVEPLELRLALAFGDLVGRGVRPLHQEDEAAARDERRELADEPRGGTDGARVLAATPMS